MPSNLHEWLLELYRNRSDSAPELLRKLDVALPEYDQVRVESPDVNNLKSVEYRADLVLFLSRGSQHVLGIIVEVQLRRDERKCYAWPAYVANLRARHRCPVCLLVITAEESVARWAAKAIEIGPGGRLTPYVVGPSNTPVVTEMQQARMNVELAVLSAIEHGKQADTGLARRIIATAIAAAGEIDDQRGNVYLDFIYSFLKGTPEVLENAMTSVLFKYQSDFARRYVAQGIAEGEAKGRLELILDLLGSRFGPLPESIQTRVRSASAAQIHAVGKQVLTAQTLEEALGALD
jgi:hypothetical protein